MEPVIETVSPVTFRAIDQACGRDLGELRAEDWPLEIWFANVYELPIEYFSLFDLARSCRQHSVCRDYLPFIVARCMVILEREPLAGELYDGELLNSVMRLPREYWQSYPDQKCTLERIAKATFESLETETDVH